MSSPRDDMVIVADVAGADGGGVATVGGRRLRPAKARRRGPRILRRLMQARAARSIAKKAGGGSAISGAGRLARFALPAGFMVAVVAVIAKMVTGKTFAQMERGLLRFVFGDLLLRASAAHKTREQLMPRGLIARAYYLENLARKDTEEALDKHRAALRGPGGMWTELGRTVEMNPGSPRARAWMARNRELSSAIINNRVADGLKQIYDQMYELNLRNLRGEEALFMRDEFAMRGVADLLAEKMPELVRMSQRLGMEAWKWLFGR